jgi:16S rRNA (guanine966-N2)-methyltransferase
MRVVAGEFRGRRLTAPVGGPTRPTTDRVREAVFNALTSIDRVVGATVADLYAGSGALGLEALSRGAATCTFVETDRGALSAIHGNIATLGVTGRTRVVAGDVIAMLGRVTCDLAFADPPYGFDDWERLLDGLDARFLVAEAAEAVAGSDRWEQQRVKRYGRTWVTFLARR